MRTMPGEFLTMLEYGALGLCLVLICAIGWYIKTTYAHNLDLLEKQSVERREWRESLERITSEWRQSLDRNTAMIGDLAQALTAGERIRPPGRRARTGDAPG